MATIKRFEDLVVWQEARQICLLVKEFTSKSNFSKDFSLKDQIRRSSGSCMDNIAEGFEREGNKEFKNFLSIAKGSIGETRSQFIRAKDYDYITQEEFQKAKTACEDLSKRLNSFINYLKNSVLKGNKFEEPAEHYGIQHQTSNIKQGK